MSREHIARLATMVAVALAVGALAYFAALWVAAPGGMTIEAQKASRGVALFSTD